MPLRLTQQGIVFAIFVVLFGVFAIFLRGFLSTSNMLNLLQNVAVLGILGLAMAIVVIGRGIDISLIAALAVPPGLVLQMVQNGHSLPASLIKPLLQDWYVKRAKYRRRGTSIEAYINAVGIFVDAALSATNRNGRVPASSRSKPRQMAHP